MLNLAQTLFLLAIDEDTRKPVASTTLRYALVGAVLADLALQGKIRLDGVEASNETKPGTKRLLVIDRTPTGDEILDEELLKIVRSGRPKKVSSWVGALGQKKLRKQIAETLVRDGVVVIENKRFRWVIPNSVFPEQRASAKYFVKQQLRDVVLASETPEPRVLVLLSILRASQMLSLIFTRDERKAAGKEVERLLKGGVFGESVGRTIEEIELTVAETARGSGAGR